MQNETGILIAIGEASGFQVVGSVASVEEAHEMIAEYITVGPENDLLAPHHFEIHLLGMHGWYTRIETIPA